MISGLIVNGQKFEGSLPPAALLLHPLLHLLQVPRLLPDARVRQRDLQHLLQVPALHPVLYAREVLLPRVVLAGLGQQPVALQGEQHVAGLAGEEQQTGQAVGDVSAERLLLSPEDAPHQFGRTAALGDGLQLQLGQFVVDFINEGFAGRVVLRPSLFESFAFLQYLVEQTAIECGVGQFLAFPFQVDFSHHLLDFVQQAVEHLRIGIVDGATDHIQ